LRTLRRIVADEVINAARNGAEKEHLDEVCELLTAIDTRIATIDAKPSVERRQALAPQGPTVQRRASRAARA
jgi:hypothetical protein